MTRWRGGARLVALSIIAVGLGAGEGLASFLTNPAPPEMSVSSATLAAPTGTSAQSAACVPFSTVTVNVTWTASTSMSLDGYEVRRSAISGGPYATIDTVYGQGTESYLDATVTSSTTYFYVVRAVKYAWRSPYSTQASVTTPSAVCS